ncbi:MAG: hypothetical protein HRU12_13300, partial [Phaeodactylibacter sp.]|nr:hypothetical protein [Phaeodactylibacter sp.]
LPDSFLVVYGWNCTGYPSLNAPTESCFLDTLVAYINPQSAEVQLQITNQPSPSEELALCDTDTIEVLVNSAQQADLVNPILDVILPPGVEVNSMSAGYPNDGSITFESLPAFINGDTVSFDLTTHSRVEGDSLPGTFSNPDIANRQMRVVFEIETGCGFNPTKTVAFYRARGQSPCNDPAIGSGILVASNPINVEGTDAPYEAVPEVELDGALVGCGGTTRINTSFSLTGAGTTDRDTSILIVPPGISYVQGSFSCDSPDADACPVYSLTEVNEDGLTEIKFALPSGLGGGTEVAFSFDIQDEGAECADFDAIAILRNTVAQEPLICNGEPCLTELIVITGQDTLALGIQKPEFTFSSINLCVNDDNTFQLQSDLLLESAGQAPDDLVTVNVYCTDQNGEPTSMILASLDFSGAIAPGSTLPVGLSGLLCPGTPGLYVEAVPSCGCGTTSIYLPLDNPVDVICPADFEVCLDEGLVNLEGASPEGGVFEGAGVTGTVFDPAVAGIGVHMLAYTYTDALGCQSSCSFEVTVNALPELTCPVVPLVCVDAEPVTLTGG